MVQSYLLIRGFTMGISKSIVHAGFAALNAVTAVTLASLSLNHFNKEFCVHLHNTSSLRKSEMFSTCLPAAESIKFAKPVEDFFSDQFSNYKDFAAPGLNFVAITSGIMSLYFAKEAVKNIQEVFA